MRIPSIDRRAENAKSEPQVLSTANRGIRTRARCAVRPATGTAGALGLGLLLAALAAVGLGVLAWWLLSRPGPAPGGPVATPGGPSGTVGEVSGDGVPAADPEADREAVEGDSEAVAPTGPLGAELAAGEGPPPEDPSRFRGEGVLRGTLTFSEAVELGAPWTLVIEPSRWLVGAEKATTRRIELPADARDFEATELPLAGYRVTAEVPGWHCPPSDVLLQRGSPHVFVSLSLERNGTVEGTLLRDNGTGAEGIAVHLQSLSGGTGYETLVDPSGHFRIEGVPEGNWRLVYGPETSPFLKPTLFELHRTGIKLPPATLPPLSWFRLVVFTPEGDPIPGATISASGHSGGVARGETDEYGVFVGRNAVPGRWTVRISHPDHGRTRRQFVVRVDEPHEDSVTLSR